MRMLSGGLRLEVTPLSPWIVEATAPDTRARLSRIHEEHAGALSAESGESEPVLLLVTFTSGSPDAVFEPTDVHLVSRGLRGRPLAIAPITPGWGTRRLAQRTSAMAVYAYSSSVDLTRDLTLSYQGAEDSSWSSILPVVEAERGRIPQ